MKFARSPLKILQVKTLGRGAFGRTMLAEKNGEQFAMKQVDVASYPAANAVLDEALRLAQLDHEAIVRVHKQFLEPLPPDQAPALRALQLSSASPNHTSIDAVRSVHSIDTANSFCFTYIYQIEKTLSTKFS